MNTRSRTPPAASSPGGAAARSSPRSITAVSMFYCLLALAINTFAGTAIARLFLDASETAILTDVHRYLVINGLAYPFLAIIFIFRNGLQGMGFSNSAMFAGLAELVARALVAFGFVGRFGFGAVCFAHPLAWVFADVILLYLYFTKLKYLKQMLPQGESPVQPAPLAASAH